MCAAALSRPLALAAAGLAAIALGACGDDDSDSSGGSAASTRAPATTASAGASTTGSTLNISADPNGALAFDKTKLTAKAGTVTISMKNPSSLPHAVAVEGNGVDEDGKTVGTGGTSTVKVDLKPGTYTFYCPVPGHEEGGMKGTLTVR